MELCLREMLGFVLLYCIFRYLEVLGRGRHLLEHLLMMMRGESLCLHELGTTEHGELRLGLGLLHLLLSHGLFGLTEIHSLHSFLRVASGLIHHSHLLLLLLTL